MIYLIKSKNSIYIFIAVLLTAGILLLDISVPLGVADGVLYITLVLIAFLTKNKKFIYISAFTGTMLTITGFFISPPGGEPWLAMANRALTILTIWMITILYLLQRGHSEKMETARNKLEKSVQQRTAELNKLNTKLERESTYVQLHKDVAIAANETIGLKDTLKVCLEKICAHANWPVGHVYLLSSQNSNIPQEVFNEIFYFCSLSFGSIYFFLLNIGRKHPKCFRRSTR